MRGFFHAMRQVFAGTRAIDDTRQYQVICFLLGLIHLIFTISFGILHINLLFVYNIFVVLFYMILVVLIGRSKQFLLIFVMAFVEILLHSIFASILLGWDWGFMNYTLGLVPVAFYISYTDSYIQQPVTIPAMASLTVCFFYFIVKAITDRTNQIILFDFPQRAIDLFYYFNTMLTFLFLWIISVLFFSTDSFYI